ncbi:hypothetical protein ABIE54_002334 [Chitinophagaceae bacterium OAS944]
MVVLQTILSCNLLHFLATVFVNKVKSPLTIFSKKLELSFGFDTNQPV